LIGKGSGTLLFFSKCCRSVSDDVSVLVDLVQIAAFLRKRVLPLIWDSFLPWKTLMTLQTISGLVIGSYPSSTTAACILFIAA
jgi:hypothetical protein